MAGETEAMTGRHSSMRRCVLAFAAACGVVAAEQSAAAQKKFLIFGDSKVNYSTYRDPSGRFEIEQPTKDWGLVPPGGSAIAIFARNDRSATIVIDLGRLTEPLGEAEIATNAQIEMDTLKEQQPNAKDFTSELFDCKGGHGALIKYSRIGAKGAERVVRYLFGVERDLYRLDGVVQDASAAKYQPIVLHMIQSFKAPAGPAPTKN
jgi:hypothetical protein